MTQHLERDGRIVCTKLPTNSLSDYDTHVPHRELDGEVACAKIDCPQCREIAGLPAAAPPRDDPGHGPDNPPDNPR